MDEHMIEKWNEVVRPQDHVWHLGDVTMKHKEYLKHIRRLNGHKRLVMGNHDLGTAQEYLAAGFQKIAGYRVLDGFIASHIPISAGSMGQFHANIHGHTHGQPVTQHYPGGINGPGSIENVPDYRYINVCVEALDYTPISLEQIKSLRGRD